MTLLRTVEYALVGAGRAAVLLRRRATGADGAEPAGVSLQTLHLLPEFQSLRGYSDFDALLRPKR